MKHFIWLVGLWITINSFAAANYQAGFKKSLPCSACHGIDGNSGNPLWPNLGGQHASYLAKQLNDFRDGKTRTAATMTAMVSTLTDQDIEDLSLYYSKQPHADGKTQTKYKPRGQQLYRNGDLKKHIAACIACHGPRGTGNAEAGFPVLSAQKSSYTVQQLNAFKKSTRKNDINHIMRDMCSRLNQDDMKAVADYIAGLH